MQKMTWGAVMQRGLLRWHESSGTGLTPPDFLQRHVDVQGTSHPLQDILAERESEVYSVSLRRDNLFVWAMEQITPQ